MENGGKEPSPKRLKKPEDQEVLRCFSTYDIFSVSDKGSFSFSQPKATEKMLSTGSVTKALTAINPSQLLSKYKDAKLPDGWKAYSTAIIYESDGLLGREKIAAFDFDGCLVNTRPNRSGADAWSLLHPTIPQKFKEYFEDGYKLVLFTNESNIERWKNSRQKAVDSKIGRLKGFMKLVQVPIQVFISCGREGTGDAYRKPMDGMWNLMEQHFNMAVPVDKSRSFYVGDAAGRPKDHSDADIGFAKKIGVKFFLPEDVFAEPKK